MYLASTDNFILESPREVTFKARFHTNDGRDLALITIVPGIVMSEADPMANGEETSQLLVCPRYPDDSFDHVGVEGVQLYIYRVPVDLQYDANVIDMSTYRPWMWGEIYPTMKSASKALHLPKD